MKAYCYGKEITEVVEYKTAPELVVFRCGDGLLRMGRWVDVEIRGEDER